MSDRGKISENITFILPQFQSLFDQMDSLPVPTTILIACSNFMTQRWYVALMVVFAIVVVVKLIVGIPGVRRTLDRGKVRMPVFGNLFKVIYTARFAFHHLTPFFIKKSIQYLLNTLFECFIFFSFSSFSCGLDLL